MSFCPRHPPKQTEGWCWPEVGALAGDLTQGQASDTRLYWSSSCFLRSLPAASSLPLRRVLMELGDPSIKGSRRSEPWEGRGAGSRLCREHESLSSSLGWASRGGVRQGRVRGSGFVIHTAEPVCTPLCFLPATCSVTCSSELQGPHLPNDNCDI